MNGVLVSLQQKLSDTAVAALGLLTCTSLGRSRLEPHGKGQNNYRFRETEAEKERPKKSIRADCASLDGPALPWKAKGPSVSRLTKLSIKQGGARGASEVRSRTVLHSFPLSGTPVLQSYWSPTQGTHIKEVATANCHT